MYKGRRNALTSFVTVPKQDTSNRNGVSFYSTSLNIDGKIDIKLLNNN